MIKDGRSNEAKKKMIENRKKYLKLIQKSIKSILEDSEVYIFGSLIENKLVVASDIDILIIADIPKDHLIRAELTAKIEENAGLPLYHPFDIHILTEEELNVWKDIYNLKYEKISNYI